MKNIKKNWLIIFCMIPLFVLLVGLIVWAICYVTETKDKISILGLVTVVIAAFTSFITMAINNEKAKEREYYFHVLKEKQKVYEHFYNSFFELLKNTKAHKTPLSSKAKTELMLFKQGLMNWGSERLIQKYIDYDTKLTRPDSTFNMMLDGNNFLKEIRKDMGFNDSIALNLMEILLTAEAREELIEIPEK